MSIIPFIALALSLIILIACIVYENVTWQKTMLKRLGTKPKPKPKLKKGQKVAFGDVNPFEERS